MSDSTEATDTEVLDGLGLANQIRAELADEISQLVAAGHRAPRLVVILVGDDPASRSYIKGKQRACSRIGMESLEHLLPESTTEAELLELIRELNRDDEVDGILVQLPLPNGISAARVAETVSPEKDADALHPITSGQLMAGTAELISCTPLGVMAALDHHAIPMEGAHAVVIGRSNIVGKPVSLLLQQRNATVTMCHSRTRDLASVCRSADILVAATGRPRMVKADWVKPGAAVIDVGVTEVDGKLVGDVDFEAMLGHARLVTPSRRGIGPLTITMLLRNTLHAYRSRKNI
ncbi:MAG: bifunctional methylenetetrahydrofolate dehydrogenase/methenyltetrahydrofolate cyclohydrolase FolD [Deltaproteobacteria bacterium]|nr:bifunctional methylenetetrahydrofolate dehydrogenase/methenyltetrahydrofolate cyclohydrolase FolD [Deltaproteobacteria bacterium]